MKIRTLIVDDEPLARERLRSLLDATGDIEVIAECSNGREAVQAILERKPDLVFLDVQMPELDGFGVLAELQGHPLPLVVFVTAFDKFALRAFEVHAVDYLLKPFDRERFEVALTRARDRFKNRQAGDIEKRMTELLQTLRPEPRAAERIAIKVDGRVLLVKIDDIDWIEAADNYVNLHIGAEAHLIRETMSALEQRLPSPTFMRISRSAMVNVERIRELQPMFHGEYVVILRNGTRLTLSRTYRDKLQHLLGKEKE